MALKINKVVYSCNLLPIIGAFISKNTDPFTGKCSQFIENSGVGLLGLCADSEEIELFSSKAI